MPGHWRARSGTSTSPASTGHRPTTDSLPPLPAVMDVRADEAVVDLGDAGQLLLAERWQLGAGGVLAYLVGVAGARDHDAHPGLVDHPAQRELRDRDAGPHQAVQLAHSGETGLVGNSGERLTHVEGLPAPVEVAMVVGAKDGRLVVAAREQSRGQRDAGDDSDAGIARGR